ncbi:MAG: DUF3237 family protein [Gammaproteobacteria bacterium]|nr:DUF3237 family protein [Gammaproteobacteria bacterium]MBL4728942.1 DUF3237 family protein [Gammaproteobacteria bacterium]
MAKQKTTHQTRCDCNSRRCRREKSDGLYWRIRPIFQTASEKHDWLNHIVCVGKSKQTPGGIAYDMFEIL